MARRIPFGRASGGERMPVVPIILKDRAGHSAEEVSAILDTGSDGTLAPLTFLKAAGFRMGRMRGQLTTARQELTTEMVYGFVLDLTIGTLELPDITVFGSREVSDVILGRNVLNQLVFTYDGPGYLLEILGP
jgi:hypothetical protein